LAKWTIAIGLSEPPRDAFLIISGKAALRTEDDGISTERTPGRGYILQNQHISVGWSRIGFAVLVKQRSSSRALPGLRVMPCRSFQKRHSFHLHYTNVRVLCASASENFLMCKLRH